MGTELTTVSKILVAASLLEAERETFSAEDLIVRAWKEYPESFGLNGYRESFPDSNRVLSKLMGSTGLCARGWLEQVGTKTYRLTVLGRKVATSLQSEVGVTVARGRAGARSIAVGAPAPSEPDDSVDSVAHARESVREERPVAKQAAPRASVVASVEGSASAPSESPRPRLRSVPGGASSKRSAPVPAATESVVEAREAKPEAIAPVSPLVRAVKPEARPVVAPAPVPASRVERAPVVAPAGPAPVASTAEPFDEAFTLGRLAATAAAQKFTRGGLITFGDACAFWTLGPGTTGPQVQTRLDALRALLARAEAHIARTNAAIRVHDRLELTLTSVVSLQGLHTMLSTRYARELESMVARG